MEQKPNPILKVIAGTVVAAFALYCLYQVVKSFGVEYTEPEVTQTIPV